MSGEKQLSPQEIESALSLQGPARYQRFVGQVADFEEVWGLQDKNGWALMGHEDGTQVLVVWPHREYADLCAKGSWKENDSVPINVHDWVRVWLPRAIEDGLEIGVFPTPAGAAVVVKPEKLLQDLQQELAQYE